MVSISGGQKPAIRIRANPTVLGSIGMNLDDLRTIVANSNVNQAKGTFDGARQSYAIGANDQILTSSDYRPLVVKYRNGAWFCFPMLPMSSMALRTINSPRG